MLKFANMFRFNCDRLWKMWYSLIVILIQLMLICLAISNYVAFKTQSNDPRFGTQWSKTPLNISLFAIIFCCSLLVLFVYSCIFKVGNIANDGVELGLDALSITNALNDISLNKGVGLFILRLKTQFLPFSSLLHVIMALLLALPLPLLQAEQIKNEAMSPDSLWITDLGSLLYPQSQRFVATRRNDILCMNQVQCAYPSKVSTISPEFLNLVLALLMLTVRLPSPFWYTNKAFSTIFSFFTFVTATCVVMEYESLTIFVRSVHNQGSPAIAGGPSLEEYESRLSVSVVLVMALLKSLLMLLMLLVVFEYGYSQFLANVRKYRQYFSSDVSDSVSQQSLNNHHIRWYQATPRLLGVVVLVLIAVLQIPFLLLFLEFYSKFRDPPAPAVILFSVAVILIYFVVEVFLWFGLCIKTKWQFHVNIQTNPIPSIGPGKLAAGSPEPVYGCFYSAPSVSSQTSMSKPMLRAPSVDGSEANSFRLPSSGNYVLMQAAIREGAEEYGFRSGADSEASYGSQSRTPWDIGSQSRYPHLDQYATLASLQSGLITATSGTTRALSDASSSNDTVGQRGTQYTRRGSNRVTFREPHHDLNLYAFPPEPKDGGHTFSGGASSTPEIPDILSMGPPGIQEKNAHPSMDPDLEMSTDMRHNNDDSRLCSQV